MTTFNPIAVYGLRENAVVELAEEYSSCMLQISRTRLIHSAASSCSIRDIRQKHVPDNGEEVREE